MYFKCILLVSCVVYVSIFSECRNKKASNIQIPERINIRDSNLERNEIAILKYDTKKHHFIFPEGFPAYLNQNELNELEGLVKKAIRKYQIKDSIQFTNFNNSNAKSDDVKHNQLLSYESYYKQAIAITDGRGDKLVWLNFFCSGKPAYWKREVVYVKDGGRCYFHIIVNLTKHICYRLSVNGAA